jgi:predicted RND superfamily exporter protein
MGHHPCDLGLAPFMSRVRDRWIEAMLAHHKLVLVLGLATTIVAVLLASRLELDSDLRSLMPKGHPVVEQLEELEDGFGTIGSVDVVAKGGTPEARHAFADAIAERLKDHELLRDVDPKPETDFFVDHALYYLSDEEIEQLSEHVMAVEHHGLCSRAPEICIEPPDPQAGEKLRTFVEEKRGKARETAKFQEYYERENIDALVVFLFPKLPSDDLQYCQDLIDEMRSEIGEIRQSEGPWTGTDMSFNVVGPYVSKGEEHRQVPRDMIRSGVVGVVGVVIILFLLFRSWRAVVVLLVPLLAGVAWSMGLTELILSHLNSMTSLISTVILGMGIDAGIHLLSRVRHEREEHGELEAIRRAFRHLMGPLLVASTTTIGAFAVMTTSKFPVFREFGLIGGSGVALCLLSMLTVFPALLRLMGIPKRKPANEAGRGALGRAILSRSRWLAVGVLAVSALMFPGFKMVESDGFEGDVRNLKSDHMRALVDDDLDLIAEIFGQHTRPSIILVDGYEQVSEAYADAKANHEAYKLKHDDSTVVTLFAVSELMPPGDLDMAKRKARIDEITEDFSETTWAKLEGREPREDPPPDEFDDEFPDEFPDEGAPTASETGSENPDPTEPEGDSGGEDPDQAGAKGDPVGEQQGAAEKEDDEGDTMTPEEAKRLRRMLEADPFTAEQLPPRLLRRLRTKDGQWGIFAYPNFYGQVLRGSKLIEESRAYSPDGSSFVGEEAVFAAMYTVMSKEWPTVLGIASLVVVLIVFAQLRSVGKTLLTLLPLLVTGWWLLGSMGYLEVKFSLFNIPVLPAIIGIGVDHGVYLTSALNKGGRDRRRMALAVDDTGRAILAASATTAIGFGSLMIADSGGLRGIGQVAVLGIVISAIAALVILPTVANLTFRRDEPAKPPR